MTRFLTVLLAVAFAGSLGLAGSGQASASQPAARHHGAAAVSVFATGLNNPRGLTFGPDGNLYVAEGGLGGTHSTVGLCPQPAGAVAPYTGSTYDPVSGGRISKISRAGAVTTVVKALPSSQSNPASGSLVSGVASVAFIGHQLYALLAGAGCSHGVPSIPNGVIKVGRYGTWRLIANLSAFLKAHPVAHPNPGDFEPDGTWYSMLAVGDTLYAVEPNHGELDKITASGQISRIADISASQGHIAIEGLTTVLGLLFDGRDRMYVLETSMAPGDPTPFTGKVIRVDRSGHQTEIASGLFFLTGMTLGPDGALYVTNVGCGPTLV